MAAVAVNTLPNSGDPAISVETSVQQFTATSAATLTAGQVVVYDSNGRWVAAAATGGAVGIITHSVVAGEAATAIRKGTLDGFNLDALSYGTRLYSGASGTVETAGTPGTNPEIGMVVPGRSHLRGNAPDKLLMVDIDLGPA